jgi:hypothetical protein
MSIYTANKEQLWIPYGGGIYYVQYYEPSFALTNTSYGSGSYGYASYGSTLASGSTPVWGENTPSINHVLVNGVRYNSVVSISDLTTEYLSSGVGCYYYDFGNQILYVLFQDGVIPSESTVILYPDVKNSPSWLYTTPYVLDAGVWKKSTVYVKVSGTWTRVS